METDIKIVEKVPSMVVSYKKGFQVVTHPAGVEATLPVSDLITWRDYLVSNLVLLTKEIASLDSQIILAK